LLLTGSAVALEQSPDALVQQVTDDVLTSFARTRTSRAATPAKAIELVETKVLPYFNFQRMTALAVGRDWSKATPEQQQRLAPKSSRTCWCAPTRMR
jgi:phospholipid transport system substrate-binding protein